MSWGWLIGGLFHKDRLGLTKLSEMHPNVTITNTDKRSGCDTVWQWQHMQVKCLSSLPLPFSLSKRRVEALALTCAHLQRLPVPLCKQTINSRSVIVSYRAQTARSSLLTLAPHERLYQWPLSQIPWRSYVLFNTPRMTIHTADEVLYM